MSSQKGVIISTFKKEEVPEDYVLVPTGNAGLSRTVRKRTLDSGQNVIELKYMRTSRYPGLIGNYVPSAVLDESKRVIEERQVKKQAIEVVRTMKDKTQVNEVFKKLYPNIPPETRDAVYKHAFDKGSKRVGTAEDLDLETRVRFATEYHVLYNMTPFEREYESQGDRLYAQLVTAKVNSIDRNYNYELFYERREVAKERLKNQYFPQAIAITETWK